MRLTNQQEEITTYSMTIKLYDTVHISNGDYHAQKNTQRLYGRYL